MIKTYLSYAYDVSKKKNGKIKYKLTITTNTNLQ